jgi:hypothetical protein
MMIFWRHRQVHEFSILILTKPQLSYSHALQLQPPAVMQDKHTGPTCTRSKLSHLQLYRQDSHEPRKKRSMHNSYSCGMVAHSIPLRLQWREHKSPFSGTQRALVGGTQELYHHYVAPDSISLRLRGGKVRMTRIYKKFVGNCLDPVPVIE